MTSLLRHIVLRHRRFGVLLGSVVLSVACLAPATASAQRCTVGVDISAAQDRYPSACSRFDLPPGLRAVGPTASGPGNGVTVFARPFADRVATGPSAEPRPTDLSIWGLRNIRENLVTSPIPGLRQ